MISTALPALMAEFSEPTLSIPMIEHQSEYSFRVAAILAWRFIGMTLEKSVIAGPWRQNPWPMPVMSNVFRNLVDGMRGPCMVSALPSR